MVKVILYLTLCGSGSCEEFEISRFSGDLNTYKLCAMVGQKMVVERDEVKSWRCAPVADL